MSLAIFTGDHVMPPLTALSSLKLKTPGSFCGGRINQMRGPLLKWLVDRQGDTI